MGKKPTYEELEQMVIDLRGRASERGLAENLVRIQKDLAMALHTAADLNSGLGLCLEAALRASNMDCGRIYLRNEISGALDLAYSTGLPDDFIEETAHYEPDSANTRLVMEGRPVYTQHQKLGVPLDATKQHEGLGAIAVIPIAHQGQVIGCLNVASHIQTEVPVFSRNALEAIAAQIGNAVVHLRTEKALMESEERFRRLSEASFEGILIHDKGKIIDMNKTVKTILGYEYSEIIGRDLRSFVSHAHKDLVMKNYRSGYELPYEATCTKKDGTTFPVEVCATNASFSGREVKVVAIRDISERKKTESALRESEERLRAIFEASPDPVVVYDQQGFPQYLNPAFTLVFGWTLDELQGGRIPFVPDDEEERISREIEEFYKDFHVNREPARLETRRLTKDGRILDILIGGSLIEGPEGNPVGMVVHLTDITETKRLQSQFQAVQRMEALVTLAGGIAHDFNNLLMAIQGNASLMLIEKDNAYPDYERLKNIEQYVQKGSELTKQLLGFARGGKYDVKPTDINTLIKQTSEMFGRTKKEVTIHGKYQKDVWTVDVDQGQIDQVLLNLYVNAWQAMPGGGELCLDTENITLDEDYVKPFTIMPGNYVKISITDTGIGMDEATRERIFEPFFTTKEMGRGTGLGLSSVYGIIKNHRGFINVYSEKDKGTTFNIYLPASEKGVVEEKVTDKSALRGSETVLLVDDEDMIIDVGKQLLERMGYRVFVSGSGEEAIEIYKKKKEDIDVVILDMIMPDMGGDRTYDILKDINPDIKVLLSSGYSINRQANDMLNRGCNGFIQKPYLIRELSEKLREILDS